MGKPKHNNGFTLLETLIVLLVVGICLMCSVSANQPPLMIFMKQLQSRLLLAQQNAFISKKRIPIQIGNQAALFDEDYMSYPLSVSCSSIVLSFNSNGAPNKACSITCTNGLQVRKIIIQLGSGRMRIE